MSINNAEQKSHPARQGFRTTFIGISVSIVLAIGKAAAGFLGHSFALIADAVESVGDIFTATVMYLGLKKAASRRMRIIPTDMAKLNPWPLLWLWGA